MLKNNFNPLFRPQQDPADPNPSGGGSQTDNAPPETNGDESDDGADEDELEETPAAADPAPAAAAAPAVALTALERGAMRALGKGDLIKRIEASEAARIVAENALTIANARIVALEAAAKTVPEKVAAAAAGRENEVSRGVRAELVNLGVPEAEAPSQVDAANTPEAMLEKFKTLKGAERTAFFRANKSALKTAEAAASVK